jgi:hypothetical protein
MKQRVITVPKDKDAEKALDYDEAIKEQLIELNIDDKDFEILYREGFFNLINQTADVNIDDYEQEAIINRRKIIGLLELLELKKGSFSNTRLIEEILNLFREAISNNTGVYFFF